MNDSNKEIPSKIYVIGYYNHHNLGDEQYKITIKYILEHALKITTNSTIDTPIPSRLQSPIQSPFHTPIPSRLQSPISSPIPTPISMTPREALECPITPRDSFIIPMTPRDSFGLQSPDGGITPRDSSPPYRKRDCMISFLRNSIDYNHGQISNCNTPRKQEEYIEFVNCDNIFDIVPCRNSLFLLGGGDVLNTYFLDKITDYVQHFTTNKIDLPRFIAFSVGVPYNNIFMDENQANKLKIFEHIFLRTKQDIHKIQKYFDLHKINTNVHYLPDTSCILSRYISTNKTQSSAVSYSMTNQDLTDFINQSTSNKRNIIGIFLCRHIYHPKYHQKYNEIIKNFARLIDQLIMRRFNIVFVPMNTKITDENSREDDVLIQQDVYSMLRPYTKSYVYSIEDELTPVELMGLYKNFYLTIPMRFHATLFSVYNHVPMIPIYTTKKIKNFLLDISWKHSYIMEKNGFDVPISFNYNDFLNVITYVSSNKVYNELKAKLRSIDYYLKNILVNKYSLIYDIFTQPVVEPVENIIIAESPIVSGKGKFHLTIPEACDTVTEEDIIITIVEEAVEEDDESAVGASATKLPTPPPAPVCKNVEIIEYKEPEEKTVEDKLIDFLYDKIQTVLKENGFTSLNDVKDENMQKTIVSVASFYLTGNYDSDYNYGLSEKMFNKGKNYVYNYQEEWKWILEHNKTKINPSLILPEQSPRGLIDKTSTAASSFSFYADIFTNIDSKVESTVESAVRQLIPLLDIPVQKNSPLPLSKQFPPPPRPRELNSILKQGSPKKSVRILSSQNERGLLFENTGPTAINVGMDKIPEFNIDYIDQNDRSGAHRSGWKYVYDNISEYSNNKSDIKLDLYVDRTFHWKRDIYKYTGIIPYKTPWYGVIHHTFDASFSEYNNRVLLECPEFLESLPTCRGIIVLSKYLKNEFLNFVPTSELLKQKLITINPPIKIYSIVHPTEINVPGFKFELFEKNPDKKLINIGGWLRNIFTFYRLNQIKSIKYVKPPLQPSVPVAKPLQSFSLCCCRKITSGDVIDPTTVVVGEPTVENIPIRRVLLKGKFMDNYYPPNLDLNNIISTGDNKIKKYFSDMNEPEISSNWFSNNTDNNWIKHLLEYLNELINNENLEIINQLENMEYDDILTRNIVFLHLVDGSAINTLIECFVRNTPIIINPHPAVVEVLGSNYPLYYDPSDLTQVEKLLDMDRIKGAHEHMKKMPKADFDINNFRENLFMILQE